MLRKLMKYDFRALSRILLPLYGAVLGLGLLNGILIRLSMENYLYGVLGDSLLGGITMIYVLSLMGVGIVTLILLLSNYFKSMFGAEGYLTHTLPVSSTTHILSKTLSAFVWFLICSVVIIFSLLLMALTIAPQEFAEVFGYLGMFFEDLAGAIGAWNVIAFVIEFAVMIVFANLCSVLMFFCAMGIGQCARKNKILASFGVYMGMNFVINLLSTLLTSVFFVNLYALSDAVAIAHIVFLSTILFSVILALVFFFVNREVIDNRLNLE